MFRHYKNKLDSALGTQVQIEEYIKGKQPEDFIMTLIRQLIEDCTFSLDIEYLPDEDKFKELESKY